MVKEVSKNAWEGLRRCGKLIYSEVNDEVRHVDETYYFVEHLEWELVAEWISEEAREGKEVIQVYRTPIGIVIREKWIPHPPYIWREEHVYLVR